jgi:hypothetical protein
MSQHFFLNKLLYLKDFFYKNNIILDFLNLLVVKVFLRKLNK